MKKRTVVTMLMALFTTCQLMAEDGSRLWLRSDPVKKAKVSVNSESTTAGIAATELQNYWGGDSVSLVLDPNQPDGEGYSIQPDKGGMVVTVRAHHDIGLLYGAYELLRAWQTKDERFFPPLPSAPALSFQPAFQLRLLNHWDNLDGSIERGYAGKSIFWTNVSRERLVQYARANASIGINGSVLNNVNASPKMLTREYLEQVKDIADIFRPYGIRVYLSINFASPMTLGFTKTADPLDKKVRQWWKKKAKEIYQLIPDFGGFLVKANSEGQPGPGDYHRTHADGANMLADALQPYGGIVVWRCFVYGANHKGEDRVKQAVSEFKPLDGQFRQNVILQTKNGPLDFQPREPYSPIFDQIKLTPNMAELQITQEYLGQSRHLVYLAPMWKEFFSFVSPANLRGVAGVSNIGDDKNWCGHHFSQANWYAFGRLAWNPSLSSEEIAEEWLLQTFGDNWHFVSRMKDVMMDSREACVNYMMPLGLHHIFKFDHHYGPEPDGFKAQYPLEWCPVYYHQADSLGVGFDRSSRGTDAVGQYRQPYCRLYNDINTCPENLLLWFHHVSWNHRMKSGRTLWEELCAKYDEGVSQAEGFWLTWQHMKPYIDAQRWREVDKRLQHQKANAREWRDVCLRYFQTFSHQPIVQNHSNK